MSVYENQPDDTSTRNANWGTLVILLVVVIIAVVVGMVAFGHQAPTPSPVVVNPTPQAAPVTQAAGGRPNAPAPSNGPAPFETPPPASAPTPENAPQATPGGAATGSEPNGMTNAPASHAATGSGG